MVHQHWTPAVTEVVWVIRDVRRDVRSPRYAIHLTATDVAIPLADLLVVMDVGTDASITSISNAAVRNARTLVIVNRGAPYHGQRQEEIGTAQVTAPKT